MANKVRGITVEIGGDTSKLGKALTEVNTQSKNLQRELNGVNSLLKLDPQNTELVAQKQKILSEQIALTTDKLKALEQAQDEVNKMYQAGEISEQQYRDFQREIVATETKLKSLSEQTKKFASESKISLQDVGKGFQDAGKNIETMGNKLMPLSVATGALLGGSVILASNFTDSMAKVETIADTSLVSMDDLKTSIIDLSNETGIASSEIAEATYNAISAGQSTADAISFVEKATSLARAGFTTTGASIDILSTIMNGYQLEASEVSRVSDILIQTQNKGKTTVDELASSMGKVIPTANAMHVGFDNVATGYAIMTSQGIASAESTTYMNAMLNELGKSGTDVSDILKEKTGKSFQDLMKDGASVGDVLGILQTHANDTGTQFTDLWSSSEAGKASLALLNGGVENFNTTLNEMNDSTGATSEALEKLDTPSQTAKVAIANLQNTGIKLGESLLESLAPAIESVSEIISKFTDWFTNLNPEMQTMITTTLTITAVMAPLAIAIGKVVGIVGTIITTFGALKTAIASTTTVMGALKAVFATSGIGLVVTAVATLVVGLGALFTILGQNESEFKKLSTAVDENKKAIQERTEAQAEADASAVLEMDTIAKQKDELDGLVDANGKVTEGYEKRANYLVNEIASATGIEIQLIDGVVQGYNDVKTAIDEVIEKKRAEAILSARNDEYITALEEQQKAIETTSGLQKEYNDAIANEQYQRAISIQQTGAMLNAGQYALINDVNTKKAKLDESIANQDYYTQVITGYQQAETDMLAGEYAKINDLVNTNSHIYKATSDEKIATLQQQIENEKLQLDSLNRTRTDANAQTVDADIALRNQRIAEYQAMLYMLNNTITEGTPAFAEVNKILAEMGETAFDTNGNITDDAKAKVIDAQLAVSNADINYVDALKQMALSGEQIFDANGNITDDAKAKVVGAQLGASSQAPAFGTAMRSIANDGKVSFEAVKFNTAGMNVVSGINGGVSSGFGTLRNTMTSLGNSMLSAFNRSLDIRSPSRKFKTSGGDVVTGAANGIIENADKLLNVVDTMANDTLNTFNDVVNDTNLNSLTVGINAPNQNDIEALNALNGANLDATFNANAKVLGFSDIVNQINELITLLKQQPNTQIVLDSGVLVGETVNQYDQEFETLSKLKLRGV